MIVLVGESASGKSTTEKELVKHYGYINIISYTTRSPRADERDGVDYHFINDEIFCEKFQSGFFAETAKYRGWCYGTAKEDCTDNKVCVVTPRGFRNLKKVPGLNIYSFYIKVPRRDRLIKILQRGDDIDEACRRSLSDVGQFDGIEDEVDCVICNDEYKLSVSKIAEYIDNKVKNNGK